MIISLDPDDKSWLDRKARELRVPRSQLVREAVRRLREKEDATFERLLRQTRQTWSKGDGLSYQRRIRGEWR